MARTTSLSKIESSLFLPTFYKIIQGGMSAGKTFAIMTILIGYCESYADSLVTVVGMSYKHLDTGSMRDFQKIMKEQGRWDRNRWNKTSKTYTFPNGSILEFLSVDKMSARGPRRDVLFVNEANGLSREVFEQLADRTKDFVIIDFNPSSEFWAHDLIKEFPDDTTFMILTYADNEALSRREIANIERHRPKAGEKPSNWWIVYGEGQIGSLEGNVYEGWIEEENIPDGYILRVVGVDFGYSNDPTAVIGVFENPNGEICLKKYIYETELLTSSLIKRILGIDEIRDELFVCDNSAPSIIAEMQKNGIRAIPCDKTAKEKNRSGKLYNIDLVKDRVIHYLTEDKEIKQEYLTYAWRTMKDGRTINEPKDGNDHALDAIAYAIRELSTRNTEESEPEAVGSYEPREEDEGDDWDDWGDWGDEDFDEE